MRMAILVHDADCRPTLEPTPRPRWRAERPESRWKSADAGFSHAGDTENEPIDWLVYHHERRVAGPRISCVEVPVTDLCGYNQSQPRREEDVHAVADLLLCFWLEPVGTRDVLRSRQPTAATRSRFGCISGRRTGDVERTRRFMTESRSPARAAAVKHVESAIRSRCRLIDQQFLLALDGRTVVAWPYRSDTGRRPARHRPRWRSASRAGGDGSGSAGVSGRLLHRSRSVPWP